MKYVKFWFFRYQPLYYSILLVLLYFFENRFYIYSKMQQRNFVNDFNFHTVKLFNHQINIFCGIKEPEKCLSKIVYKQ